MTINSKEAWPVAVKGSAARPEEPFGFGTSTPRNSSVTISGLPFSG
ncbi:hypothetical protein [Streptomyces roseolilacinus]|nr:hypothetical protein [Streptomyces roseolilacinus]